MAKEIKTRARSLESILEGVEIKHPLVRRLVRHEAPSSHHLHTVLDSSSSPSVGHRLCRSGIICQREHRTRESSRRGIVYTKGIIPSWAIFQRHPHVIVRLVSRTFCAPLTPVHNSFSLLVPGFLRRTRRNFLCPTPPYDASAALRA